jgi:hypothetical protein
MIYTMLLSGLTDLYNTFYAALTSHPILVSLALSFLFTFVLHRWLLGKMKNLNEDTLDAVLHRYGDELTKLEQDTDTRIKLLHELLSYQEHTIQCIEDEIAGTHPDDCVYVDGVLTQPDVGLSKKVKQLQEQLNKKADKRARKPKKAKK